ncbi:MAG: sporulation inhibitor of replication protein SirA [Bacilli bacterium]|nr:sporulation inhibitor of replication protein SirA [Bacilli bacterium]
MRTFHVFNVDSSIEVLTKKDSYPLFHSFLKIKNLNEIDLSMGINLFEQIAKPIDKKKFSRNIYNHYKDCDFYSKFKDDHTYINKYRDEKSYLKVKSSCIKIDTNRNNPEFFKYLKKNHSLFVCDFNNKDYFWISDI